MIAIIDYDIGNIHSVHKAFMHIGAPVVITSDPADIRGADGVVLPGVGAFGDAMSNLRRLKLLDPVYDTIHEGVPFLGICVGMQVLFEVSEEIGTHRGLGVLSGSVKRFAGGLKVPQIGWNQIHPEQLAQSSPKRCHPLLAGTRDGAYVYFAQAFHVIPAEPDVVSATTDYGGSYPSAVASGNVCGIQFHPEKSQRVGLRILGNFIAMTSSASQRHASALPEERGLGAARGDQL